MSLTVRDLEFVTDHQRQLRLLADAARPIVTDHQRQLRLLADAARATLATHQHNLQFFTEQAAHAARGRPGTDVLPVEQALATRSAGVRWASAPQLLLRALVLAVGLALLIAYWEEQRENAPAEALVVILGALKVLYEIDDTIWKKLS
jgi:hypothetical protein